MRYYLFGMDAGQPLRCARELRARGITAVVQPPNPDAADACRQAGVGVYGCYGAFGIRKTDPDGWLTEDVSGERKRWFGSGCPSEDGLFQRNLEAGVSGAQRAGAECLFSDGLRFASPAPIEEPFTGCFCPRCRALGESLGFDMDAMRSAVARFRDTPGALPPTDWLAFRERIVAMRMHAFRDAVHSAGLRAGAFVFAPSIASLVGQTEGAMEGLDICAPMLYRRYRPLPGTACLNAEVSALASFCERRGDADIAAGVSAMTGLTGLPDDADTIWRIGFEPETVGAEAAKARAFPGTLAPILQLDDDRLAETIACCKAADADAIGFFAYDREALLRLPELEDAD